VIDGNYKGSELLKRLIKKKHNLEKALNYEQMRGLYGL